MEYRPVLNAGTVLDGKYRIERVIGSGGFGVTYEARDLALQMAVAIKEYYPATLSYRDDALQVHPRSDQDREMFDRLRSSFEREARTLAQFESPAIVRILGVFEGNGTTYMVMKYESGPNLKAWRRALGRRPAQAEVDALLAPLLDALEVLHDAGFLHRDIAPDNIIVRPDGTPVLLDFGASRRVMGELTGTLTAMIKPGFSPAEQYTADPKMQGPWTDIYAFGATVYQMITGNKPTEALERFEDPKILGDAETEGYRPDFLQAIEKAMRFRPENRHRSIAEFRNQLLDGAETQSRRTGVVRRTQSSLVVPITRSRISRPGQRAETKGRPAEPVAPPSPPPAPKREAFTRTDRRPRREDRTEPEQLPASFDEIPTGPDAAPAGGPGAGAATATAEWRPGLLAAGIVLIMLGLGLIVAATGGATRLWNVVISLTDRRSEAPAALPVQDTRRADACPPAAV